MTLFIHLATGFNFLSLIDFRKDGAYYHGVSLICRARIRIQLRIINLRKVPIVIICFLDTNRILADGDIASKSALDFRAILLVYKIKTLNFILLFVSIQSFSNSVNEHDIDSFAFEKIFQPSFTLFNEFHHRKFGK